MHLNPPPESLKQNTIKYRKCRKSNKIRSTQMIKKKNRNINPYLIFSSDLPARCRRIEAAPGVDALVTNGGPISATHLPLRSRRRTPLLGQMVIQHPAPDPAILRSCTPIPELQLDPHLHPSQSHSIYPSCDPAILRSRDPAILHSDPETVT